MRSAIAGISWDMLTERRLQSICQTERLTDEAQR